MNRNRKLFVAVAGNIGSGKTSLTELLAARYGWKPYYEDIDNPYLDDFYQNMERWSFNLQISFLSKKIAQLQRISGERRSVIQDRTIYEEALIFVRNLHDMLLMSQRDYNTYLRLFELIIKKVKQPDLLIYLKADTATLKRQIIRRGRSYEQGIDTEYLNRLNNLYNDWVDHQYKGRVLIFDIDRMNFIDNPSDLQQIYDRVDAFLANQQ